MNKLPEHTFGKQLRVRVCGLLWQHERLLLACHEGLGPAGRLWLPPGGGAHFGSSLKANLQREFVEETGLQIEVKNLCWINEHLAPPLHAVEFFFEVNFVAGRLKLGSDPELPKDAQLLSRLQWFSMEEINHLPTDEKHPILHDLPLLKNSLNGAPRFFFAK